MFFGAPESRCPLQMSPLWCSPRLNGPTLGPARPRKTIDIRQNFALHALGRSAQDMDDSLMRELGEELSVGVARDTLDRSYVGARPWTTSW